jgi:uncharacterized membrane protein
MFAATWRIVRPSHSLVNRLVLLRFLGQSLAMVRRFSRPVVACLLGLAFALSATLSAAQAAAMSAQMATIPGMGMDMGGHPDCGGCTGTTDKDGMKNAMCVQFCAPALAAILPVELGLAKIPSTIRNAFGQSSELSWASAPDPSPPKS